MAGRSGVVDLKGELDVSEAEAERQRILSILESPDVSSLEMEIHGGKFTQPALQILFAALREAAEHGVACRPGPNAGALLKARLDNGNGAER